MKSGSWASYRAAGAFGDDRDDDEPAGWPVGPPDRYAAVWYEDTPFRDVDTGEVFVCRAETGRHFTGASHAKPYDAARRWAAVMARRHGVAWVREGWDGGESFESKVLPGDPP